VLVIDLKNSGINKTDYVLLSYAEPAFIDAFLYCIKLKRNFSV
jgi:hypothetical protein